MNKYASWCIRGIGNAYAVEILWGTGISPFSTSNKIPDGEVKGLLKSIKRILQKAEKNIVKTHPDIISGEICDFMRIHIRKKNIVLQVRLSRLKAQAQEKPIIPMNKSFSSK